MALITLGTKALPSGSIIQVKNLPLQTEIATTSTSFIDVGTLTITPTNSSNKIFILSTLHIYLLNYASNWKAGSQNIKRDSTDIFTDPLYGMATLSTSDDRIMVRDTVQFLDTPNTINEITYKCQVKTTGSQTRINHPSYADGGAFTLMEVQA
jgi:hypothetical protein